MSIVRHYAVGLVAVLALQTPALCETAEEIFAKAQSAARAVTAVQYEARSEVEGPLADRIPKAAGTILVAANPGSPAPHVFADVEVDRGPRGKARMQLACDGKYAVVVDHARKIFARRSFPEGISLLSTTEPALLVVHEFVLAEPFKDYAKTLELVYVGEDAVDGTPCDLVQAGKPDGNNQTQWAFAKTDRLPRRLRHTLKTPDGQTVLTITLKNVTPQPPIAENAFKLEVPDGFQDVNQPKPRGGAVGPGFLKVGVEPPDWTLKDDQGRDVSLKSLRGKVVVLDFWATWCGPCRMAMPSLQKLHEKFKDKPVAIYGVNCWQHRERRKVDPIKFMRDAGFTYPLLLKADKIASAYGISGIPACYVIGPDSKVLYAYGGWNPDEEKKVEALIEGALQKLSGESAKAAGTKAAAGNGPTTQPVP